ncbi:uncharacterized protein CMU_031700 [Cryptosporidium muris RN66]|uniref:Uncharacterized protein n=1 Tax=Cryptosporidium muris (strain RN66) TaxID=441375 RepID=B6AII8_CRYMR|nr:uncharacterized protein CMU_031700 [Cryptosporidium muris RN66]EEA08029.1 hypothetical protein, conserved [Cryptosporidium muris RN66]|eukprot:XP_002142378.1 hypothetical protein [Cryptosporidium muris RN66]
MKIIVSYFEHTGNNEQLCMSLLKLKLTTDSYSMIYKSQQGSEFSNINSIQIEEELTGLRRMCKGTLENVNYAIRKVRELKSKYRLYRQQMKLSAKDDPSNIKFFLNKMDSILMSINLYKQEYDDNIFFLLENCLDSKSSAAYNVRRAISDFNREEMKKKRLRKKLDKIRNKVTLLNINSTAKSLHKINCFHNKESCQCCVELDDIQQRKSKILERKNHLEKKIRESQDDIDFYKNCFEKEERIRKERIREKDFVLQKTRRKWDKYNKCKGGLITGLTSRNIGIYTKKKLQKREKEEYEYDEEEEYEYDEEEDNEEDDEEKRREREMRQELEMRLELEKRLKQVEEKKLIIKQMNM